MRALSHPLRVRLLELFWEAPRTTKQAALALGLPPTRLYHHVAALEKAGLIRLKEERSNRGATEKYFEAVGNRVLAEAKSVGRGRKEAEPDQAAMGMLVFDQARSELLHALASEPRDPNEVVMAVRAVLHLSAAGRRRLAARLRSVLDAIHAGAKQRPTSRAKLRRYSLTIALLPAPPER
ncbi:MAG: winged helix-turn-helix domain-containing protein [Candidatus Eisenbacteria bacterium]